MTTTTTTNTTCLTSANASRKQVSRTTTTGSDQSGANQCFSCHLPIRERFLLKALDQYWHEDCLKCSCCDCRLGEVGSTLFAKANLILCKRDYLRLFGNTANCSACNKTIPGFEMVMRARSNVYHLECFSCFQCHQKFCVGDRFYLHENKILCEYDYEERMAFANMSAVMNQTMANGVRAASGHGHGHMASNNCYGSNGTQPAPQTTLLNGKRTSNAMKDTMPTSELCDATSSGYGSADSPFS